MNKEVIKTALHKNLVELGIQDSKIRDETGSTVKNLTIRDMMEENMWLPMIMIKVDEICTTLTGKRMFTCAYGFKDNTLTGLSLIYPDDGMLKDYGYEKTSENLNQGFIDKVLKLSLTKSITISNEFAVLKESRGLYHQNEGDTIFRPLPNDLLYASLLGNYIEDNGHNIDNSLKRDQVQEFNYK
jgi:hypothetical protein